MKLIKHRISGEVLVGIKRDSLKGAHLSHAELEGADLRGEDLQRTIFKYTNLRKAFLTGANLLEAHLYRANLTCAVIKAANLTKANLKEAKLARACLVEADLTGADLTGADLTEANLKEAKLARACLVEADLTGADLTGANLTGADLSGTIFSLANLNGTKFGDESVESPYVWMTEAEAEAKAKASLTEKHTAKDALEAVKKEVYGAIDKDVEETIKSLLGNGCTISTPETWRQTERSYPESWDSPQESTIDKDVEEGIKFLLGNIRTISKPETWRREKLDKRVSQLPTSLFFMKEEALTGPDLQWGKDAMVPPSQPEWPTKKDIEECCGVWVWARTRRLSNVVHIDKARLVMFGSRERFEEWRMRGGVKKIGPLPEQYLVEATSPPPSPTDLLKRKAMKCYPPGSTWNNKEPVKPGGWFDEFLEKPMPVKKCVAKYPRVTEED